MADHDDAIDERLERCAAYIATRAAVLVVHRASEAWPLELADRAKRAAVDAMMTASEALGHHATSPARRRSVRGALTHALEVSALCDVARAYGVDPVDIEHALQAIGRAIVLLSMLLHASAQDFPEDSQ